MGVLVALRVPAINDVVDRYGIQTKKPDIPGGIPAGMVAAVEPDGTTHYYVVVDLNGQPEPAAWASVRLATISGRIIPGGFRSP